MTSEERVYLIDRIRDRLNAAHLGVDVTTNGSPDAYEVACLIDDNPCLLFVVEDERVYVVLAGGLYEEIKQDYAFSSKITLFNTVLMLLWDVFSTATTLPYFLSVVTGEKIRNWANLLIALAAGLNFYSKKVDNTLFLDDVFYKVEPKQITMDTNVETVVEYDGACEMLKAILGLFSYQLVSKGLDILCFDPPQEDDGIITEDTSGGDGAPAVDLDIDASPDMPAMEGSPELGLPEEGGEAGLEEEPLDVE